LDIQGSAALGGTVTPMPKRFSRANHGAKQCRAAMIDNMEVLFGEPRGNFAALKTPQR
jgi:hypothetical protein